MKTTGAARNQSSSVAALIVSLTVSTFLGALLMAAHAPVKNDGIRLGDLLADRVREGASWKAVHILVAGCNCSRAVEEHLINRRPLRGVEETVVIAGSDDFSQAALARAGFTTGTLSAEEAASRYQLHGAPWLVFVAPDGKIAYAGGYAATADARGGYQDVEIWKRLQAGAPVAGLPAFGCLVGQRLRRSADPFGIKY